jgi:DNA gyrase/topoisomerase IV subunit B
VDDIDRHTTLLRNLIADTTSRCIVAIRDDHLRVEVTDALVTDRIINELMGKDASARFRFIMEHAEDASELDV